MAELLLLTPAPGGADDALPALALLGHRVRVLPAEPAALLEAGSADLLLLDGRRDLATARSTARLLQVTGRSVPLLLVVTEGGLAAVHADWGVDDVVLDSAGPAEVEARIRLAIGAAGASPSAVGHGEEVEIRSGDLVIDPASYSARARGRLLDLTYKEFELIKYLAQHPGRAFTRAQLLQEVWGYDYYGGTRTVDVHVRRLRAKLGPELEQLIATVRNVGYRFEVDRRAAAPEPEAATEIPLDARGTGRVSGRGRDQR